MASKPVSYEGLAPIASAVVYIDLPNRRYMLTSVVALTSRSHLTLVPVERGKQLVSDAMLCNVGVGNAIASRFGTFDGGTCSAKVPVQATPERVANLLSRHRLLLIDLGPPVARVDVIVQGPRADEIAELSMGDKAMRVVRAMTELPVEDWQDAFGDAGVEALKSLKEPQTLATLAFVFAIWAFAQTNPSGWAMDAALIGIAVVSLGLQIFGWIRQLEDCLTAIGAIRTPEDEKQAARALLKVLGRLGIDVLITLLTRAAGKAVKATAKPMIAKPSRGGGVAPAPAAKSAKPRPAKSKKPPPSKDPRYKRGKFRKGKKDEVWENAKDKHGKVYDPVTGKEMRKEDPWQMGHKPGYEHRKHQKSASDRDISRDEFLDEFNDPKHYRPEIPQSNMSHKGEDMTDDYFGD